MASCLHNEVTIDSMMFFSFLPFLKGPLISATTVLRRGGAKFASYLELKNTCIIINVKQAKTNNNNKTKTNKTEKKKKKKKKKTNYENRTLRTGLLATPKDDYTQEDIHWAVWRRQKRLTVLSLPEGSSAECVCS